jgi:NAD(P)-dependent dehydrogenase (short-subunit alcohol dehydrogenase family)
MSDDSKKPSAKNRRDAIEGSYTYIEKNISSLLSILLEKASPSELTSEALIGAYGAVALTLGKLEHVLKENYSKSFRDSNGQTIQDVLDTNFISHFEAGGKAAAKETESAKKILAGPMGKLIEKIYSGEIDNKKELAEAVAEANALVTDTDAKASDEQAKRDAENDIAHEDAVHPTPAFNVGLFSNTIKSMLS